VPGRARRRQSQGLEQAVTDQHQYTTFETRNGWIALAWSPTGVSGLRLPAASELAILKRLPLAQSAAPPPPIARLITDIVRYFDGEPADFSDVPVDLGEQSPFFSAVYTEIRKLGRGETTTYGAIAKALGAGPQFARDVGQAMATNPVPLIVPCHRVLAAGGKVGGFSAPGGSQSKAKMLEIEGVKIAEGKPRPAPKVAPDQIGFDF
jgi:methylated-DNA-[protein]-cysteine S-methyltransferase